MQFEFDENNNEVIPETDHQLSLFDLEENKQPDEQYCLEFDDDEAPSARTQKFLDAIDDLRNGKPNAADKLAKYVDDGTISAEDYDRLIKRYGAIHEGENAHKASKSFFDVDKREKLKEKFLSILAFVVLLHSFACALVDLVVQYGKGIALFYFILWFWAVLYCVKSG